MTSYVTRERIRLAITFSNGNPRSMTLELVSEDAPSLSKLLVLGTDSDLVSEGSGVYSYSFVPSDDESGYFKWRWYGLDSDGIEFAAPSTTTWNHSNILSRSE
jgi:hypothetical protein